MVILDGLRLALPGAGWVGYSGTRVGRVKSYKMIQTTTLLQKQNWTLRHPLLAPSHPLPAQGIILPKVTDDEACPTLHLPDSQHMATIPLEYASKSSLH